MTPSQARSTLEVMSTIELPDDVAAALSAAAAERGVTEAEFIAGMVSESAKRRSLSFVAAGRSGSVRGGAEAEELLEEGGFGIDTADR